jgi:hypothetical protein
MFGGDLHQWSGVDTGRGVENREWIMSQEAVPGWEGMKEISVVILYSVIRARDAIAKAEK